MPDLTLYRRDGACSMVPNIVLKEIRVPYTTVLMKAGPDGYEGADGNLTHPQFLKLNPSGFVPTLSVDGIIVTEMPAILTYLTSLAPERNLLGSTLIERVRVASWMNWLSGTLHAQAFGALWRPQRFVDDETLCAAVSMKGRKNILRCYERIENSVSGSHAVGSNFTVLDVYLHTFWRWGCDIGVDMKRSYPKYAALMRSVENLQSVRAAMAEEHQTLTFEDTQGQV